MTLARVKRFLDLSGADREAGDIINADGIYEVEDNPQGSQGHSRFAPHAPQVDQMHQPQFCTSHISVEKQCQYPA